MRIIRSNIWKSACCEMLLDRLSIITENPLSHCPPPPVVPTLPSPSHTEPPTVPWSRPQPYHLSLSESHARAPSSISQSNLSLYSVEIHFDERR
ncbi:hypothetical protein BaRGS_00024272 [Batillaria attramentaria]|uniref:Uncharacterized protein n=1 Tax=Batillaria attramentaria TaxID=370345 RepID=A0ABD0KBR6_9CAEN